MIDMNELKIAWERDGVACLRGLLSPAAATFAAASRIASAVVSVSVISFLVSVAGEEGEWPSGVPGAGRGRRWR